MLKLTDEQKRMYEGEYGPGVQRAMNMLVKCGNAFDAERMVRVDSAHSFISMLAMPTELLSQILEGVNEVKTFSTLHATRASRTRWAKAMGIRPEIAEQEAELLEKDMKLYQKVGFHQTFTCVPYLVGNILSKGMVFSWPGTSGIIIGNSLFGAMGNRDAVPTAICSAITGLTPEMLLTKPENRRAELLVQIEGLDLDSLSTADFGALGYYIGDVAGAREVAVLGIHPGLSFEKLKYFLTPLPVSGAVSLCHIVGVTPEAPTLEAALGNGKAQETIKVSKKEMEESCQRLTTAKTDRVDAVYFGCPHCTISEIKRIAQLLDGRKVKESVRLWVSTADGIYTLARRMGYVDTIENAGGLVVTDLCLTSFPFDTLEVGIKTAATNSAKAAHYQPRIASQTAEETGILYGSTEQCIAAAITGKWGG